MWDSLGRSETVTQLSHKPEALSDCIHALTRLCNPTSGDESDKPSTPAVLKRHGSSALGEVEVTGRVDSLRFPKSNTQDTKTSDCLVSLSADVASTGTIVEAATTPLPFGNSLHHAVRWWRTAFRWKVPQSNRLLLYERQCSTVCENDEVSLCCEEGQFCTTSKGNLIRATPTDVTPVSSSQAMDLSSATKDFLLPRKNCRVFYSNHHCGHTYNFCISDTAFN
jgi:hypothetical protein